MNNRSAEMLESLVKTGEWNGIHCHYTDTLVMHEIFDQKIYKHMELGPGDVVLDLGAHVGLFGLMAQEAGVERVVSVEPFGPSARYAEDNYYALGADTDLVLLPAAVGRFNGTVHYYVRDRAFSSGTRRKPRSPNRTGANVPGFDVPQVSIFDLLDEWRPNKLKIDIEGAEYDVLLPDLPNGLEGITHVSAELHRDSEEMLDGAIEICRLMENAGFTARVKPPEKTSGWPAKNDWKRP